MPDERAAFAWLVEHGRPVSHWIVDHVGWIVLAMLVVKALCLAVRLFGPPAVWLGRRAWHLGTWLASLPYAGTYGWPPAAQLAEEKPAPLSGSVLARGLRKEFVDSWKGRHAVIADALARANADDFVAVNPDSYDESAPDAREILTEATLARLDEIGARVEDVEAKMENACALANQALDRVAAVGGAVEGVRARLDGVEKKAAGVYQRVDAAYDDLDRSMSQVRERADNAHELARLARERADLAFARADNAGKVATENRKRLGDAE